MVIFVVTAVSNGANLTDGLDGLAAGSSAIIGVALGILAYMSSHFEFASFLNIMFIPGAEELVVFASAFIGATIGFLWYNAYPAQVFMGDTGSLTLGGIIAVFAIIIRKELLIPILCGIFLVENLSVILQTFYFKYTKRKYGAGRRIFKMAPLHHHFQKAGNAGIEAIIQKPLNVVPESKIVVRFWLIGIYPGGNNHRNAKDALRGRSGSRLRRFSGLLQRCKIPFTTVSSVCTGAKSQKRRF